MQGHSSVAHRLTDRKGSIPLKAAGKRKQVAPIPSSREIRQKTQKAPNQGTKTAGEPSDPLDVDSDPDIHGKLFISLMQKFKLMPIVDVQKIKCVEFPEAKELKDSADFHWVVAHVTPPSWKQHLKELSLEKLCDIHDKSYIRKVVLDNVLNRRTRKLMTQLSKVREKRDALQQRERAIDKEYVELKLKCDDALQDLEKISPCFRPLRRGCYCNTPKSWPAEAYISPGCY